MVDNFGLLRYNHCEHNNIIFVTAQGRGVPSVREGFAHGMAVPAVDSVRAVGLAHVRQPYQRVHAATLYLRNEQWALSIR